MSQRTRARSGMNIGVRLREKKHLRAAQLELFDDVADLFKPVDIAVVDTS